MDYKTLEQTVGKNSAAEALDELARITNKGLDEYDYIPVLAMDKSNHEYGRRVYVVGRKVRGKSEYAVIPVSKVFSVFDK